MNCTELPALLGYHCAAKHTDGAGSVLEVAAPFSFHDGRPVVFYAFEEGDRLVLSDEGLTLFHLANSGIPFLDKRRWRPVKERVERHGAQVSEDGSIETIALRQDAPLAFARFIAAMLSIIEWERDNIGMPVETAWLADETELYLRAWKPAAALERNREVSGITGRPYRFDFFLDGEFIDVLQPQPSAVGGVLRKVADVARAPGMEAMGIRVIVDDRRNPERAKQEIEILGAHVRAWPISRLISHSQLAH